MKYEIITYIAGFITGIACFIAYSCGRKKSNSDNDGVRRDNNSIENCTVELQSVTDSIKDSEHSITRAIKILSDAKERAEKKDATN